MNQHSFMGNEALRIIFAHLHHHDAAKRLAKLHADGEWNSCCQSLADCIDDEDDDTQSALAGEDGDEVEDEDDGLGDFDFSSLEEYPE